MLPIITDKNISSDNKKMRWSCQPRRRQGIETYIKSRKDREEYRKRNAKLSHYKCK